MMQPGPRNLITDVAGLRVGHAQDEQLASGTTVLTGDAPFVSAVHVMGGAPGTRETDLLAPDKTVQHANALVLSGGSALGLSAASGVADRLRAMGQGFDVGGQKVPIVPAAILFDLLNGGDKSWNANPYPELGAAALDAVAQDFDLGSVGAGCGATTADLAGGLGSASVVLPSGHVVGALVAVNALGSAVADAAGRFWAAPWELGEEFGGRGVAQHAGGCPWPTTKMGDAGQATTIGIVATNADLTQAQATRMATAAHDGFARALVPSHTPMDGDLIFAAATAEKPLENPEVDTLYLGHAAACAMARAIARGVYAATAVSPLPNWRSRFGA